MNTFIGFIIFLTIWIAGCAMADYVFLFEDRAWSMFWGYVVAITGLGAADLYKNRG